MAEAEELSLWEQFNLAENNPDPGGGILYAIRYGTEALLTHRDVVIEEIVDSGTAIFDLGRNVGIDLSAIDGEANRSRVMVLLEELSVISEAIEWHESGINDKSIAGLSDLLRRKLMVGIATDQLTAFDFANITIPQIVRDLETAHRQNGVLSKEEHTTVRALGEYAATRAEQIAHGDIIILGQ